LDQSLDDPIGFENSEFEDKRTLKQIFEKIRTTKDISTESVQSQKIRNPLPINQSLNLLLKTNPIGSLRAEQTQFLLSTSVSTFRIIPSDSSIDHSFYVCVFESHLKPTSEMVSDIEVFGETSNTPSQLVAATSQTSIGNLFQLGAGSTRQQIFEHCRETFFSQINEPLKNRLTHLSRNLRLASPRQNCNPELSGGEATQGHSQCRAWAFRRGWSPVQKVVPRCIRKEGMPKELGHCALRATQNGFCPIFADSQINHSSFASEISMGLITEPSLEQYFCDELTNLTCVQRKTAHQNPMGICKGLPRTNF
jgi:hypothetical protein